MNDNRISFFKKFSPLEEHLLYVPPVVLLTPILKEGYGGRVIYADIGYHNLSEESPFLF